MLEWTKKGRREAPDINAVIITYTEPSGRYTIESRRYKKKNLRGGTWTYTEYVLIYPDGHEKTCWRLADAKAVAEFAMWAAAEGE